MELHSSKQADDAARQLHLQGMKSELERTNSDKYELQAELTEEKRKRKAAEVSADHLRGHDLREMSLQDLKRLRGEQSAARRAVDDRISDLEIEERAQGKAVAALACVVCLQLPRSVVLMPCRHFGLCGACSATLSKCPQWREEIAERVPVYVT